MTSCVAEHRSPETCAERCPDVVVGDGRCAAAVEDHPELTCGEGTDMRDGVKAAVIIGLIAVLGGVVIQSSTASDTEPLLD